MYDPWLVLQLTLQKFAKINIFPRSFRDMQVGIPFKFSARRADSVQ